MRPENVVRRFLSAAVIPFKPKSGVPTTTINGRKYVLSTNGGPLGDREDDDALAEEYGDRLIAPSGSSTKWRYLWAYDTDKQVLAMWRVSDGSEKFWDTARNQGATIVKLDKKGELNRLSHEDFSRVVDAMNDKEREALEDLKRIVEESKGDMDRAIDRELAALFKLERPKLEAEIDAVKKGVIPIGFKPHRPDNVERQVITFVIGQFFRRHFSTEKMMKALAERIPGLDDYYMQEVKWAIDELHETVYDQLAR